MSESATSIHEQAGEWIIRRELPDWNAADQAQLNSWLEDSLHHRIAYLRASDVWERADRLRALQDPTRRKFSLFRNRRMFSVLLRGTIAAGVVGALGIWAATYLNRPQETVYTTAIGGRETIPLSDGSQVELNTDTVLRVSETPSRRIARLDKG